MQGTLNPPSAQPETDLGEHDVPTWTGAGEDMGGRGLLVLWAIVSEVLRGERCGHPWQPVTCGVEPVDRVAASTGGPG